MISQDMHLIKLHTSIKWKWIRVGIISLFLISTGCSELPGTNEDTELISIEKGLRFTVMETHDQRHQVNVPVEPFIQLQLETKGVFSCLGYGLVSNLSSSQSDLMVEILGVEKPDGLCLTAVGPAVNRFQLDVIPGEYKLAFRHNGTTRPYQLMVTDSSLQVSGEASFITPDIKTFWRYPEQSFAYLCHSTSDTRWMCEEFKQMLNDSLEILPFTFPDYGTKPFPGVGKTYDIASYYRYSEESVFQEAGEMLEAYTDSVVSQQDGAYLSIISWKNQGFRSWTNVEE